MDIDTDVERTVSVDSTETPQPTQPTQRAKQKRPAKRASKSSTPQLRKEKEKKQALHPKYPNLPPRSTKTHDEHGEPVYCICRKPDSGLLMVGCDGCDDWFHFKCIKIDQKYSQLIQSYFCPYCEMQERGQTLWKRKCRVDSCYKPIMGKESKYCSRAHGLEYMKAVMAGDFKRGSLSKEQIYQVVKHVSDYTSLQVLGSAMPRAPLDITTDVRIQEIEKTKKELGETLECQSKKLDLLNKTRENLKKLGEELASTENGSTSSKKKPKKIDLCGFDPVFNNEAEFFSTFDETTLETNDIERLKTAFLDSHKDDDEQMDDGTQPTVCLLERKKCQKHAGWQAMINDEVNMIIRASEKKLRNLEEKRDDIIKVMNIDYFEHKVYKGTVETGE